MIRESFDASDLLPHPAKGSESTMVLITIASFSRVDFSLRHHAATKK